MARADEASIAGATVSVVVPTLNAADRLPGLISALLLQTRKPDEIFVVDSASEDETATVVQAMGDVRMKTVSRASFNHGTTRHEALLDTTGDIVCFFTDDAVPANRNCIANLCAPFADSEVAMVSGRQLPRSDARRFEQLVRAYNYSDKSHIRSGSDLPTFGIKTYFASNACSAYRRDAYLSVGGFSKVNTNEDMLIAARFIHAGYKVAYAADAEVFHSHNLTFKEQFRRNREIGRFLELHAEELACPSELGEGGKLARSIAFQLVKERNATELVAFGADCVARLAGNRAGRRRGGKALEIGNGG